MGDAVDIDDQPDALLQFLALAMLEQMMFAVGDFCGRLKVGGRKELPDVVRTDFAAVRIGVLLDDAGELDLEAAWHDDPVLGFHQVGDAALARLAVDADHRIVGAANVGRVDREIGH